MSAWISVDERLPDLREIYRDSPRTSGSVLIFNGHFVDLGKYEETFVRRDPRWQDCRGYKTRVTHWMPLPNKPEGGVS